MMATSMTARPSDGLLSVTLLEVFAGLLFLGFIVLSAAIILSQKMPVVEEKKDIIMQPHAAPLVADEAIDGMADRLAEKLDRNFRIRDDRLGRMIVGLGDKLDHMKDSKELQWSQLRKEIDEKLETLAQEAIVQGSRGAREFGESGVNGSKVVGDRIHVAQIVTTQTMPVVNDVSPPMAVANTKTEPASVTVAQAVPATAENTTTPASLEEGIFNLPPTQTQKQGYFISLGCFSQASNALERGSKVRPFTPSVYRKIIRNGDMSCLFSGPFAERGAAQIILGRLNEGTGIPGFSLGSY
ncbi:MAG: hypothetical protein HQL07_14560 [Nitrospirae bacterium]|nr:hypothetical protein [Magnetococcales bacterium]HAT50221.1 hypothetical protein [Alphaproteobacteria bacterium]